MVQIWSIFDGWKWLYKQGWKRKAWIRDGCIRYACNSPPTCSPSLTATNCPPPTPTPSSSLITTANWLLVPMFSTNSVGCGDIAYMEAGWSPIHTDNWHYCIQHMQKEKHIHHQFHSFLHSNTMNSTYMKIGLLNVFVHRTEDCTRGYYGGKQFQRNSKRCNSTRKHTHKNNNHLPPPIDNCPIRNRTTGWWMCEFGGVWCTVVYPTSLFPHQNIPNWPHYSHPSPPSPVHQTTIP